MNQKQTFPAILSLFIVMMAFSVTWGEEETVVDRVIAVVDEEIILESEVFQIVQDFILNNRSQFNSEEDVARLKDQVLQELINQKIMLAVALEDTNVVVEDRQVDQTLSERIDRMVQEVGSVEKLEEYFGKPIRQIRREYRSQVRDGLFIENLRNRKLMGIVATRSEVENFYNQHKEELPQLPERIHIAHILIPVEPAEQAKIRAKNRADSLYQLLQNGAELEQLAIDNSDDPASGPKGGLLGTTERGDLFPEYEEVAYNLEEGEISSPMLSRLGYHIIKLNWRRGEKINTSHILIGLKPDKSDEQRALQAVQLIHDKLEQGASFEEMAKQYSQDEQTAANGGDLGWFDVTSMPDEFRIVANSLKPGEVSEPFKTQFGIHLLKVLERDAARPIDLYKDWERVSRMATAEKKDKIYREWVDSIRKDVYVEIFN